MVEHNILGKDYFQNVLIRDGGVNVMIGGGYTKALN